jgi:hypothetical protein
MSEQNDQKLIPSQGGVFNDLALRIKLIFRLMGDARVSPLLKLLPIGSLLYFLIPDIVLGPIDDVMVVWLGSYLFIELCPPEIVSEHVLKLTGGLPGDWNTPAVDNHNVIEGEFHEPKD